MQKCCQNNVWIFGAGETGRLFAHYISAVPSTYVEGFVVDRQHNRQPMVTNKPVLLYEEWLTRRKESDFIIIAVTGDLKNKERIYKTLKDDGSNFYTYIHPTVFRDGVTVGDGSFIFENNVLQAGVSIGNNTILWSGNHVGHQTTIGNHCFLASHVVLCGLVQVGNRCFIGVNAAIAPNVIIGDDAFIGMGVNITRNVPNGEKITIKDTRDVYKMYTLQTNTCRCVE